MSRFSACSVLTYMVWNIGLYGLFSPLSAREDSRFEEEIPFVSGGSLRVLNTIGGIEVRSWDRLAIHVTANKVIKDAADNDHASEPPTEIEVVTEAEAATALVRTIPPDNWHDYVVDYRIYVPKGIDLQLETSVGKIHVTAVVGHVNVRTNVGNIELEGVDGTIESQTGVGAISAVLRSYSEGLPLKFVTRVGEIHISLPSNISGLLHLETKVGTIESTCTDYEVVSRMGGRFSGRLNGGDTPIEIRAQVGDIRVEEM